MQQPMRFDNIAIIYVKGNVYRTHFWYMSEDDAINIMNGSDDEINIMNGSNLIDKRGVL